MEVLKQETKVRSFYKKLNDILEEDEDLNAMHLTRLRNGGDPPDQPPGGGGDGEQLNEVGMDG